MKRFCPDCYGSGEATDGNGNNPNARIVRCDSCDGTGFECPACRETDDEGDLCGECALEAVEAMYEGSTP
jgi:hypothetical protein